MNKAVCNSNLVLEDPRTAHPKSFDTRDCFLEEKIFCGSEGVCVVSRATCIPRMVLCLFARPGCWHAADHCRYTDWGLGTPILEDGKKIVYAALHAYTDCFKLDL